MRLFHYTIVSLLKKILDSKQIAVATIGVPVEERPVVWFSARQDWEPTATPSWNGRQITFEELCKIETPARIEINPQAAPLNWKAWRTQSGVKARMAWGLEVTAIRLHSSVAEWRMSFDPVGEKDWLAIEIFLGGVWTSLEPKRENE